MEGVLKQVFRERQMGNVMAYLPIKLLGIINTNPAEAANSQIAAYVLDNLEHIDYMSAGSLATACNVSKSSVSRFCRELSYEDFYHFQLDAIRYTRNHFQKFAIADETSEEELAGCYLDAVEANIEKMKAQLDEKMVWQIADDIAQCSNLLLLGNMQSGDIAYIMQHNLFVAGKSAVVSVNPSEQRQLVQRIGPDTVIIIFSVSGSFFECLGIPNLLEKRPEHVKLYCVTANPCFPIPSVVDGILDCGVENSLSGGNLCMELAANLLVLSYQKRTGNGR
jgi:DNA-binding MurR/RpiR family transcriptional regulator